MQKPQQILALETKLSYSVTKFDALSDLYLQSHLARYLIIITAGYFEQVVQASLTGFAQARAHTQVVNYVDTTLAWEGSINRSKLERILGRFDKTWFAALEARALDAEKGAVDSVKDLRDQLAHGNDHGIGYSTARAYHFLVRDYASRLLSILP
jgi:HEPN superfamily RiboL-PSP-like protein